VVGTYRDVEVDRNHPLSAALAELIEAVSNKDDEIAELAFRRREVLAQRQIAAEMGINALDG
jgi:hypothetical protein